MTPVLRFAPSPTGLLHIGNIRTALANWLFARKHGGRFILRMDDTDTERSKAEYAYAILEDMKWLGMDHDSLHHQSDRSASYEAAAEALKKKDRLYPCYETPEELNFKRKQQLARGQPPIYDRAALQLSEADRAKYEASGRNPHWRLKLEPKDVEWQDQIHGTVHFDGDKLSDPVLIREDGKPIYTLSTIVDDIELGITHIFRGDDHIANTAVQIQLIEALGVDSSKFTFGHMPLLTDHNGKSLSKRLGSLSIQQLRQDGVEAMAINCHLASLGTSESVHITHDMQTLIRHFDPTHISRSSPKFVAEELMHTNEKLLHLLPFAIVKDRLKDMHIDMDESTWDVLKGNLHLFADIKHLWQICTGSISPVIEEPDFTNQAASSLPAAPWDENTWRNWTNQLKQETGRKGKELYMPLRKALTGMGHGPEMMYLLPIIGYERAKARLQGKVA